MLLLGAVACGDRGLSAADATELVEPHLSHFADFDRWARRAIAADPEIRDRASLEETIFAPIRRDERVRAVWIHRGEAARTLAFGAGDEPPKDAEWVTIRTEGLGEVGVTTAKIPDPRAEPAEGRTCVVVRRSAAGERGGAVTVTVAYDASTDDRG